MAINKLFGIAAILIGLAIICGAFGAHGLKDKLDPYYLSVFEKAAFYHITQSAGLILILFMAQTNVMPAEFITKIFYILLFGILVFSGSLYLLAVTQIKWLGAITPIGGTAMIVAWGWLGIKLLFS